MVSEPVIDPMLAAKHLTALDDYVEDVFSSRALRAMRKRPILAKKYRSRMAHLLLLEIIYRASSLEKSMPFLEEKIQKAPIPDFASRPDLIQVAKCVSGQYQLPEIAARNPDLKVIYNIRHPCGQTFSHMNGLKNARVILYEDICADPVSVFRELFEWCGLDWHPNCAQFIKKSTDAKPNTKGYHTLVRSPKAAANKWKSEMPVEDIKTVASICRKSSAAALFPEL